MLGGVARGEDASGTVWLWLEAACSLALNLMPWSKWESCGREMFNVQAFWAVACGLNTSVLKKVNSGWEDKKKKGRGMLSERTEMEKNRQAV